jgi:anti-sigma B factor antagonist
MSLNLKINNISENKIQIIPVGEVDIYTSPEFKTKLLELVDTEKADLLIDGTELDYIDSTGLGVLMSIYKTMQEKSLKLEVENLKPNIYKLFDITGLNKIFNIK